MKDRISFESSSLVIHETRGGLGARQFDVIMGQRYFRVTLHPNFRPIIKRPCGRGYTAVKDIGLTGRTVLAMMLFPAGVNP